MTTNAVKRLPGLVLVLCALLTCSPASEAATEGPVNIDSIACDAADAKGAATYTYVATWQTGSTAPLTYILNVGNQCTHQGKSCGVSNELCQLTCTGTCKVQMHNCQFGQAGWFQDSRPDIGYQSKRVPVFGPRGNCRKK